MTNIGLDASLSINKYENYNHKGEDRKEDHTFCTLISRKLEGSAEYMTPT